MKEMYWIGAKPLSRRYRKMKKSTDLSLMWREFLWWAQMGIGQPGTILNSNVRGILAYSFEREGFPKGDEFDRMRVRVTGAMPLSFKVKLIEEVKSGKRHIREF